MRRPSVAARLLGLYALLHAGLFVYDLWHPGVWLTADRAGERIRRIGAILQLGDLRAQIAYAGQHNVPGDYIPQAILYGLGGRDLLLLVQIALCLVSVACVHRIACIVLGSSRRALIAACLYALLPQTLVFPHQLSAEAWFVPFTVLGFYYAARWVGSSESAAAPRSGLSWAWASLTRPTPLPFALLTGAVFSRRVRRGALVSFLLALLLPFAAWVLLVHASTGYWSLEEGTSTTLGRNLLQRVTFITESLPPGERAAARARYIAPALRPPSRGVSVAGYLRFCGEYLGPCATHLEHDAFNFFVKSGIEKLTIDYLELIPPQARKRIDGSTPTTLSGWQMQFRDRGLAAAVRFYFARYPLVAALSVAGALGFGIVLMLYLAGAAEALLARLLRHGDAAGSGAPAGAGRAAGQGARADARAGVSASEILGALLAVFPVYLFAATSVAGFMESRYRAAAEFAMVILAVRGWSTLAEARDAILRRIEQREVASQFVRFAAVGIAGFVVDVSVLYAALSLLGVGPYAGRAISYVSAASVTWYLNRQFTFADRRSDTVGTEWAKFVLLNGVGGLLNYATYAAFLQYAGASGLAPMIGVALGSLAGLCANFALSRQIVFRKVAPPAADSAR